MEPAIQRHHAKKKKKIQNKIQEEVYNMDFSDKFVCNIYIKSVFSKRIFAYIVINRSFSQWCLSSPVIVEETSIFKASIFKLRTSVHFATIPHCYRARDLFDKRIISSCYFLQDKYIKYAANVWFCRVY